MRPNSSTTLNNNSEVDKERLVCAKYDGTPWELTLNITFNLLLNIKQNTSHRVTFEGKKFSFPTQ